MPELFCRAYGEHRRTPRGLRCSERARPPVGLVVALRPPATRGLSGRRAHRMLAYLLRDCTIEGSSSGVGVALDAALSADGHELTGTISVDGGHTIHLRR